MKDVATISFIHDMIWITSNEKTITLWDIRKSEYPQKQTLASPTKPGKISKLYRLQPCLINFQPSQQFYVVLPDTFVDSLQRIKCSMFGITIRSFGIAAPPLTYLMAQGNSPGFPVLFPV